MKTNNCMQLKAKIKNKAQENNLPPDALLQHYLLERVLERIALSAWRDNLVVKGGVLIGSMSKVGERTTRDLDATIRGHGLTEDNAINAFREILAIGANDDFQFQLVSSEEIRDGDCYPGMRLHLRATYEKIDAPLVVDITTGDCIVPDAITYSYPLMFEDRSISLMAYPVATILAEKLETVLSRGLATSRMRDFYDIKLLWDTQKDEVSASLLREALLATAEHRHTTDFLSNYAETIAHLSRSGRLHEHWRAYQSKFPYARQIELEDACSTIRQIMDTLGIDSPKSEAYNLDD